MDSDRLDSFVRERAQSQAQFSTLDPQYKPDDAARSFQLQRYSGIPAETIGPDPKEFDENYQNQLRQGVAGSNPYISDFVNSHPLHAQLIKDDLPSLDRLTTFTKQVAERQSSADRADQFVKDFKAQTPGYHPLIDPWIKGIFNFEQSLRRTGSVLAGDKSAEQMEESPYGGPILPDLQKLNLGSVYAKTAFRLANAFPSLAVGIGATALTADPLVGIAAGALSVGAISGLQELGDQFQRELAKSPEDPDGAYNRALVSAGTSAAFSTVGMGLFPLRFLNGPVKSVLFQVFGVQPAVGLANRITQGYLQGQQPNLQQVTEGYIDDVIGAAIPLALFEGIRGGKYALRPGTAFRPYAEGGPGFEITPPGGPGPRPRPAGGLERPAFEGLVEEPGPTDMTRRGFLQGVGAVGARAALPRLPVEVNPFEAASKYLLNQPRTWRDLVDELHPAAVDFAEEFMVDHRGEFLPTVNGRSVGAENGWTAQRYARSLRDMADWYAKRTDWDPHGLWSMHNMTQEDMVKAHNDAAKLIEAGFDQFQAQARVLGRLRRVQTIRDAWQPQDQQKLLVEGQQADENKKAIDIAVKEAESTNLKKIAPEKLNELLSQLPSQNLRIRAEAIAKLYNKLSKDPNPYLNELATRFERTQGMLSSISTDSTKYIANIPADIHKALADHIALGDDMAVSEVKEQEGLQPPPPQEQVFLPAVNVKGQMFEDEDHASAFDQAIQAFQGQEIGQEEVQEGYSTTHGRFVDPQEAFGIAQQQGQLRENAISPITGSLEPGDLHVVGARSQARRIGRDVRDQLVLTYGLDAKLAAEYGDLIASYYYRRSVDTGMSPDFLYESDGISFRWGDGDSTSIIGFYQKEPPERPNLTIVQNSLEGTPETTQVALTRFGDLLKEAGFPTLDMDTLSEGLIKRREDLYKMLSELGRVHAERGTINSPEAVEFMKRLGLQVDKVRWRQKELEDIYIKALDPLSRIDKLWYNHAQRMTPQEFLQSEALWSTVREVVQETGAPENFVFAETANRILPRLGVNTPMTPIQARIEMARQRGIRLLQPTMTNLRGRITLDDHVALIELFKQQHTADTLAHEFYHLWIYNVFRDAMRPGASTKSIELRDDLLEWLGHKRGSIVDPDALPEGDHELAADGGLNYLREGKAPSLELVKIFESFKNSLTNIYRDASSLGLPLTDSIRNFFQRIVATDEEIRRVTQPEQQTLDVIRHSSGLDIAGIPDLSYQAGQELEALLKNLDATPNDLYSNPLIQEWTSTRDTSVPTATIQQARDPNWRVRRTYILNGKEYGGDNIIPALLNKTAEIAGGPDKIKQEKTAIIFVGPPGAGKSTFQNAIAREYGARIIDVDDIRTVIPEYKGGQGLFATLAEGQGLTLEVMVRALARGDNILHPIVGADPETSVRNIMNRFEDLEYKMKVVHVWADPNILVRRVISRFIETGRIVGLPYILTSASNTPLTYERLKVYADEAAAIDTTNADRDNPPQVTDGEGTTLADIIRRGSGTTPAGDVSTNLPEGGAGTQAPTRQTPARLTKAQARKQMGLPRTLGQDETTYLAGLQSKIEEQGEAARQVLFQYYPDMANRPQTVDYYMNRVLAGHHFDNAQDIWSFIHLGMPSTMKSGVPREVPAEFSRAFQAIQFLRQEAKGAADRSGPRTLNQPPVPPGGEPPSPGAEGGGGSPAPPRPPSPPFTEGAAFGRTQRMYRQYLRMIHQRDMEDVTWRQNRAQKLAERLNSREWEETVNRIMPGIRARTENLPEIAAYEALTKREVKIARDSLTPDQQAMLPRAWMAAQGYDINTLANYFQYDLGEELVNVLAAMRRATEGFTGNIVTRMTKALTYQQAMEELGDTMQARLDEVEDHALSLTQMELVHERYMAYGMQAGAPLPLSKAAGDWAIFEGFQASDFRNLKADRFLREAGKWGREIEKAGLTQDILGMFRAAQAQYVALSMAKHAKTVEREVKAFQKVARKFRSREVEKIDVRFTNFIHDILMRANAGQVNREPADLRREIGAQHDPDEQTLRGFLARQQAQGNYIPVPSFLLDPAWTGNIQSMDIRSARQVMNAVKILAKVGRDLDRVVVEGERRDLMELVDKLVEQLETLPKERGTVVTRNPIKNLATGFLAAHLQMETLFNRFAYGRAFGLFNQVLRPMIEAANKEAAWDARVAEQYRALPDVRKSWELNAKVQNNLFKDPNQAWTPTPGTRNGEFEWNKPGVGFLTLRKKNVRAILLNAGNPDNLRRFAEGFGVTQQQVMDWLLRNTEKADWDWAQAHGKIFAELKKESDAVYRRLNGVAPEAVPIYPIQTPFGVYEGWYHPVIHDEHFYGSWQSNNAVDGLFAKEYNIPNTPQGYTKARTNYSGPLSISLDAVPGRLWQEIHDISFRETIMNTYKIFSNNKFRNQIRLKYGEAYSDLLDPWLRQIANSRAMNTFDAKTLEMFLDFVRENAMATMIGFNLRTVQKHFTTAAANSFAEVPVKDMFEAMFSSFGAAPGTRLKNFEFAMKNSLELQRRHQSFMEHVSGAQSSRLGHSKGFLQLLFGPVAGFNMEQFRKTMIQYGTAPVAASDLISAVPVWLAAYRQIMEGRNEEYNRHRAEIEAKAPNSNLTPEIALARGITPRHEDAVYYADRAVRRAHGSTAVTNRPWAMTGMGPLGKFFSTFYSFFNHMAQRQYELAWRARVAAGYSTDQEAIDAIRKDTNFLWLLFCYVIVVAVVEELVTPMTNHDKMSWSEMAWKTLALGLSSSWLGLRDVVHGFLEGNDANVGIIASPVKGAQQIYRDLGYTGYDPMHAGKDIKDFSSFMGFATGMSNTEIGNLLEYAYDLKKGNAHPSTAGDWWRGLTKGREHPREDNPDMVERFLRATGKDRPWK